MQTTWKTKRSGPRDGTLEGYTFSKRYKKVSPHRKSQKNKPSPEMVNKRGVPIGPTWLIRTLAFILSIYVAQDNKSTCIMQVEEEHFVFCQPLLQVTEPSYRNEGSDSVSYKPLDGFQNDFIIKQIFRGMHLFDEVFQHVPFSFI